MTTEVNCGQVRGRQLNFARSIDPIVQQEITITRMAVTSEKDAEKKDREMGENTLYLTHSTGWKALYQLLAKNRFS